MLPSESESWLSLPDLVSLALREPCFREPLWGKAVSPCPNFPRTYQKLQVLPNDRIAWQDLITLCTSKCAFTTAAIKAARKGRVYIDTSDDTIASRVTVSHQMVEGDALL